MHDTKITVGILFGGKSAEHEVSLQSAKNVFDALDKEKYTPVLIGIDTIGRWHLYSNTQFLLNAENPELITLNQSNEAVGLVPQGNGALYAAATRESDLPHIDVAFPILHGPFGEDGTVQGLLKLANIPFVGCSVLSSAVSMDKDVMKRLLRDVDIPIGRFIVLKSGQSIPDYADSVSRLGEPLFVKPANMGSSVGVSKVCSDSEYKRAIDHAFLYDTKILIEEYIAGREIECAVLGNDNPIASVPGEVMPTHDFYSYDAKYIDENGATFEIPAHVDSMTTKKIQDLAVRSFQTLSCEGLARVDFFLKENGTIVVNEVNTMPGFTKISMYPKMMDASGICYSELIDRLIQLAFDRFEKEQALRTQR